MMSGPYDSGSIALSEPPPRRTSTTVRPPGGVFSLQDRLPGVMGSIAPPSAYAMRALAPTPRRSSSRPYWLAGVLVVLTAITSMVVYRDMNRTPVVTAPAE